MRRLLPLLASLVLLALPTAAHAFTFYEWDAPEQPAGIAQSGSLLYYTLAGTGQVAQGTLNGVRTPLTVGGGSAPSTLVPGPGDNHLWFIDPGNKKVGRTNPGVSLLEFATALDGAPSDLAAGQNGTMWVTESSAAKLACVTTAGVVTEYASTLPSAVAITRGGDGAMWILDTMQNSLGRFTPPATCPAAGAPPVIELLPLGITVSGAVDIAPAPSGNDMYVAAHGALVRYQLGAPIPTTSTALGNGEPSVVHSNTSGVWWIEATNKRIGKLVAGVATEWALPRGSGTPYDFALASDASLWYVSRAPDNRLGRFAEEVGPQGPQGPLGNPGTPGAPGDPGTPGTQGPQGNPGAQGVKGDQGASVLGSPGAMGPAGPAGARGATGATGPKGARGKTGPAAKLPKISCKLSGSKVTCKVSRSGGSDGSGGEGNSGGGEGLRLRLSRAHKLYATGSRAATRTRTKVNLHAVRRLTAGKYTLVVTVGADVTIRVPVRLG